MQERFPPRGTPEWRTFVEQFIVRHNTDIDRLWQKFRQPAGAMTGLNPVQNIVTLGFTGVGGGGSGSGSGSGSGGWACTLIIVKLQYSAGETLYYLSGGAGTWVDSVSGMTITESGGVVTLTYCGQVWTRSVALHGNACQPAGGFSMISNAGACLVPTAVLIVSVS